MLATDKSTAPLGDAASSWKQLHYHAEQQRLWNSDARFAVALAGRGSGKSLLAIRRRAVRSALMNTLPDGLVAILAPTRKMVKRLHWTALKRMVPRSLMAGRPSESDLTIPLVHGPKIMCEGVEDPERIRGLAIDDALLDEVDFMRPDVWDAHVQPCLTRGNRPPGRATFAGTPDGHGLLWRLMSEFAYSPDHPAWDGFRWSSRGIVDDAELDRAKKEMDPRLFAQEYEAQPLLMSGRAYHEFERGAHAAAPLAYDPKAVLFVCFDFNVEPGVACIVQERTLDDGRDVTDVIGEVWIPRNSNTPAVCRKIAEDWGKHLGPVKLHGDATGGARHTSGVLGTDWDLIRQHLKPVFGERLVVAVGRKNPRERDRVNAMNSRLRTADGLVHMRIDPVNCPHVIADLERVTVLEGGSGELDKKADPVLTHMSDALGYLIAKRHPVGGRQRITIEQVY